MFIISFQILIINTLEEKNHTALVLFLVPSSFLNIG